jgi:hypothetical protein
MKKLLTFFFASLLVVCALEPEQVFVIVTATPRPITATAPPPTNTSAPTHTPKPTSTPKLDADTISEFEQALRSAGYSRYP